MHYSCRTLNLSNPFFLEEKTDETSEDDSREYTYEEVYWPPQISIHFNKRFYHYVCVKKSNEMFFSFGTR